MRQDESPLVTGGVRRRVLADGTYDAIRYMIINHEISPGVNVGIDSLARELSVSQTPVREALARLEADGLVTKVPLRGYRATDLLSVEQFDELFQYRALIEPWAAMHASRRSTRREIEAMEAELARAETISGSETSSTYQQFAEHDARLHALIARASGNAFVEEAFTHTHCHMHLLRVYKATLRIEESHEAPAADGEFVRNMFAEYYRGGTRPLALTQHVEIVGAISSGDGKKAHELMLDHIESSRQRFIPAVEALNLNSESSTRL